MSSVSFASITTTHELQPSAGKLKSDAPRVLVPQRVNTVPVIFGVLTTETQAQAEERADVNRMNKGRESMEAALEMIQLLAPPPRARAPRSSRPKSSKVKR